MNTQTIELRWLLCCAVVLLYLVGVAVDSRAANMPSADAVAAMGVAPVAALAVDPAAEVIPVRVSNPQVGGELVLFALGFLCGAVAWRMFVGRW